MTPARVRRLNKIVLGSSKFPILQASRGLTYVGLGIVDKSYILLLKPHPSMTHDHGVVLQVRNLVLKNGELLASAVLSLKTLVTYTSNGDFERSLESGLIYLGISMRTNVIVTFYLNLRIFIRE